MAMKYKPINKQCPTRSSLLIMHVGQEWVCGNWKYSTQKKQYKHDTLMDTWKREKLHSKKIL